VSAPVRVTVTTMVNALAASVRKMGHDYVYAKPDRADKCVYTYQGKPSCLIGHGLVRLGVKPSHLRQYNAGASAGEALTDLVREGLIEVDDLDTLTEFCDAVQEYQDMGLDAWGDILDNAMIEFGLSVQP